MNIITNININISYLFENFKLKIKYYSNASRFPSIVGFNWCFSFRLNFPKDSRIIEKEKML